jgi:uncharacterized protein
MPMIRECIVTTIGAGGVVHIAPLGLIAAEDHWIIAPFRPSTTLENLRQVPYAIANWTDDVRIFAGCLTGRRDWPTCPANDVPVPRLEAALAHAELAVVDVAEDSQRPRFRCRVISEHNHRLFGGLNRAKAAVVEAAILTSRLHMLPRSKIMSEVDYLKIAIDKTAGPEERQAWDWLMERIAAHHGSD